MVSRRPLRAWVLATLLVALSWALPARSTVVYVDPERAVGGDGTEAAPYSRIADALVVVQAGDELQLAEGVYDETLPLPLNGVLRAVVLPLPAGVVVRGAGRGRTVLRAPAADPSTFGIAAVDVGAAAAVYDLTVDGPCYQGINLRGASPVLVRLDVLTDIRGSSSVALDAREGSFPTVRDCVLDGGHSALFVEFGSGGHFTRTRLGRRSKETLAIVASSPVFEDCTIEGGGSDTIVLTQGSAPVFADCEIGEGDRWTVRVFGYAPGSLVDLRGNRWFSEDPTEISLSIQDAEDDPGLGARVVFLPLAEPVATSSLRFGRWKSLFDAP